MASAIILCSFAGIFLAQSVIGTLDKGDGKAKGPKVTDKVSGHRNDISMYIKFALCRFILT